MEIFKEFSIEAAHLLPNVPEGHKCRRLHGHSFQIAIHVRGALEPKSGWVMDFADVGEKFQFYSPPSSFRCPLLQRRIGEKDKVQRIDHEMHQYARLDSASTLINPAIAEARHRRQKNIA